MTTALKLWPLLTATHHYDKSLSTRNRDIGKIIQAPILAYLIETTQGRILVDVGCDFSKINTPEKRARYYDPQTFEFGAPNMLEEQRLPHHFARLGLTPADIDVVFLTHLHFDHAGGLCDVCNQKNQRLEVHIQKDELLAANTGIDEVYFDDEVIAQENWKIKEGDYEIVPGIRAIRSPGHTAGHMSLWIEMPTGAPIILAGDAADLQENISDEVAPGVCWQGNERLAIESIQNLKRIAKQESAEIWPNHDIAFWKTLKQFPEFHR